jgi:hypothetical protein
MDWVYGSPASAGGPFLFVLYSSQFQNSFAELHIKRGAYASSADDYVERNQTPVPSPRPTTSLVALQGRGHVPALPH